MLVFLEPRSTSFSSSDVSKICHQTRPWFDDPPLTLPPPACRTIGHTINTIILLLPTLYYWNDPRWKFVLLAKLTLPEAVWEQATHYFTRQLHNVHKFKIVPLLILDALFFANGGAQQVLSGPKDGLYYFMFYYFVVFMGGNLVEVRALPSLSFRALPFPQNLRGCSCSSFAFSPSEWFVRTVGRESGARSSDCTFRWSSEFLRVVWISKVAGMDQELRLLCFSDPYG